MRKKRLLLLFLLLLLVLCAGLWFAGPQPLASGAYLQSVTSNSAIVVKVDRAPRTLQLRYWRGRAGKPRTLAEDRPATVHRFALRDLQPAARYAFVLEAGGEIVAAGQFRTAPVDDEAEVRFAALGDSGGLPWWHNMHKMGWSRIRPALAWTQRVKQWDTAEWVAAQDPQFFLHLGDIVYWRQIRDAHEEAFFLPFGELLRQTPLFALVGNHDIPADGSEPPFHDLFRHPSPAGIGQPQRNYVIHWGSVRVVVLDVMDPAWKTGPSLPWFEKSLREATEPWLVVATHVPCFSVYREEWSSLRDELYVLMARHHVDLVLSGDDHHYARFKPSTPGGPIQVIAGGGGKNLYDHDTADSRLAASAKAYSFVLVTARGRRLECKAFGSASQVLDSVVVERTKPDLPEDMSAARRARITRLLR